ncbi:hypothetical protein BH23PAT2_BH23PAT2_03930 [soil metagenome]
MNKHKKNTRLQQSGNIDIRENRLSVVLEVLRGRLYQPGHLHFPKSVYFDGVDGLDAFVKSVAIWLDHHQRMTVTVTPASVPHGWEIERHSAREWSILIEPSVIQQYPYTALSYICLALSAITMHSYSPINDVSPHDILVYAEEMTLQAGLGIYILNATKESTSHSWRPTHRTLRPLQTYTATSYTEAFLIYCKNNKISSTQYDEHLLPRMQKQLAVHALHPKSHIKRYIQGEKRLHERFTLLGLCLVGFLFLMPSLWGAIPKPLSPQQQSWRQEIDTLKQQHTACEASLKRFFDTVASPDILSSRSLQAKKHECDSIKQKHDVLVGLLRTSRN